MAKTERTKAKVGKIRDLLISALGKATMLRGEAIIDGDDFMENTIEVEVLKSIEKALEGCALCWKHATEQKPT